MHLANFDKNFILMKMNCDFNEGEKKDFINKIYEKNWKIMNPEQCIMNVNNFEMISYGIYADPSRFLIELIQNCDDSAVGFKKLEITITVYEEAIIISHKGKKFDQNDILSICSSGNSSKMNDLKLTGYKGIGFKSIFYHSSKVLILSDGYQFRFDEDHFTPENCWQNEWGSMNEEMRKTIKKPWQIIPLWTELSEIKEDYLKVANQFNASFIIYFKDKKKFNLCKQLVYEIENDPFYFLFLKSKNINLSIYENKNLTRQFEKKEIDVKKGITALYRNRTMTACYYVKDYFIPNSKFFGHEKDRFENDKEIPKKLMTAPQFEISFAVPLEKISNSEYKVLSISEDKRNIYCFLPTKQNFNFPFLINSNFILDSARTQIKEHIWNENIFRFLPEYINFFVYQDLYENFGNSYAECLLNNIKINLPKFRDIFNEENEKFRNNQIFVKSFTFESKPLNRCYINEFNLEIEGQAYYLIEDFMTSIYGLNGKNYINEYLESKNIEYDLSFEIRSEDIEYITKISEYHKISCSKITTSDIIGFLTSEIFKKNFTSEIFYKYLLSLYKSNVRTDLKNQNHSIFLNDRNEYKYANEIIIIENSLKLFNEFRIDFNLYETLIKKQNKSFIHPEIYSAFENEIYILEEFGIQILNSKTNVEYLKCHLYEIYKKENTIDIIRTLFHFWKSLKIDSDIEEELISKLADLNYLTEGGNFVDKIFMNINYLYGNDNIKFLPDWSISRKYLIPNSKIEDWFNFFSRIGITHSNEPFTLKLNRNKLKICPYFTQSYKNLFLTQKIDSENKFDIYVFPEIYFF
jgi:hypothetical protein